MDAQNLSQQDKIRLQSLKRQATRQQALDSKARALGFGSLSDLLTKWKNGEIKITVSEPSRDTIETKERN